jgi:hypothetical protein
MGRPSYVCTVCSEHFTRRYSGKRHNDNLHNGAGEIVRLIDYLAGRSSGKYLANNPFWYKRSNPYRDFRSATVADSVGDAFPPSYIPKQAPVGTSQYSFRPLHRPMPTVDHQNYGTALSRETKLEELKRLMYKYAQFHNNSPDEIVKWAIYCSSNGDNKFLDEKLEQLRTIDSLLKF